MVTSALFSLMLAAGTLAQSSVSPLAAKVAALRDAPTQVDRIKLLDKDSDFVFDFLNATAAKGAGGSTVGATVANFPALVNNGIAMTVGFLGPCGMNTPHTHPRATEILYLVNGTLSSGMIAENGARFVFNTIHGGSATVFPRGSIHFQQNEGCDPIVFVAALNNEDPGVESIAQRYFGLPPDVVAASLGDLGVQEVAGLEAMIPDNIALGTQECLDRCGISRGTQPTTQRQPRNANNALPSGAPASASASASSSASPGAAPTPTHYTRNTQQTGGVSGALAADAQTGAAAGGVSSPVLVALVVVVSVMGAGYLVLAAFYVVGSRRRRRAAAAEKADRWYVRPAMAGRSLVPTSEERAEEKYDPAQ
ncbi:RmlC-like cupin domain-containing protein [Trametes elegans]|nr:RmlC-like cupin domain-containing protein [Trametes elegans]